MFGVLGPLRLSQEESVRSPLNHNANATTMIGDTTIDVADMAAWRMRMRMEWQPLLRC